MAADLQDGFDLLIDGMNLGLEAEDLPASQFAKGINVVTRKGRVRTRFGFSRYILASGASGTFQGGFRYQLNGGEYFVWVMSGHVYMATLGTGAISDLTTMWGVHLSVSRRCYFVKAEKFCIIQDGDTQAVIIDGTTSARHAVAVDDEVPVGTIMAYGHGRLFVVPKEMNGEDGRRFIVAGDIYLPNDAESLLTFTEPDYLAGGGALSMPAEFGFIGGLGFMKNADTGNGYGPLMAFARRGVAAFAVNEPRETLVDITGAVYQRGWQEIDIRQILFSDVGSASPFALLPVNADLLFRGTKDGVRSLSVTYTEVNSNLRNVSMSGEMQDIFDEGNNALLGLVSSAFSDNRILFTAMPDEDDNSFKVITSLDMAPVNNVKNRLPPSFDGVFTGGRWTDCFTAEYNGRDRLFVVCKTDTGIELVYEDETARNDPDDTLIECRVYTKKFNFASPIKRKHLNHVRLWMSGIQGNVSVSVYARADDFPYWVQLGATATFQAPITGAAQQRRDVVFSANKRMSDPIEKEDGLVGYTIQLALVWSGKMTIRRATLLAEGKPEPNLSSSRVANENVALTATGQLDLEATDYDYRW